MAQPETAAGGEDLIVHVEPTVEDRLSAALNAEPVEEQQDEDEAPPEAVEEEAPEAEPETDESEDEIEIEAEDLPPIEAPISWNAEDKAKFAELPRHLQETVGKREAEREKFVQSKAQEAAQAKEAAQVEAMQFAAQLKAEAVERLTHYAQLLEVPEPDIELSFSNDPNDRALYVQQARAFKHYNAQRQQAQREANEAQAQQAQYQTALQQHEAQVFRQRLEAELPEAFGESGQLNREFIDSLTATAETLNYDVNAIQHATVDELVALKICREKFAKADKYDKAMAKQMERVREGKKLPPVSKPGAAKAPGSGQQSRYQADREAMRRGDKEAELRVLRAHINS